MLVKTSILKKAISTVMGGVQSGSVKIEGSDLVIFMNDRIMSYNGNVTISIPLIIGGIECGILAKDLSNLVSKLKGDEVDISSEVGGNKLLVKCGTLKAKLAMQDITNIRKFLEKLKFGEEKKMPENFVDAVKVTAISDNSTAYKGFGINGNKIIATDKARISIHELDCDMDRCVIDDTICSEAIAFGKPITYSIVGPWFNFGYENGAHFSILRSDDTEWNFDGICSSADKFINGEAKIEFEFPETLAESIERVSTLGGLNDKGQLQVSLKLTKESIIVTGEKNTGMAEDEVKWSKPIDIESDIQFRVPTKTFLNIMSRCKKCKITSMTVTRKDKEINLLAVVIGFDKYNMIARVDV